MAAVAYPAGSVGARAVVVYVRCCIHPVNVERGEARSTVTRSCVPRRCGVRSQRDSVGAGVDVTKYRAWQFLRDVLFSARGSDTHMYSLPRSSTRAQIQSFMKISCHFKLSSVRRHVRFGTASVLLLIQLHLDFHVRPVPLYNEYLDSPRQSNPFSPFMPVIFSCHFKLTSDLPLLVLGHIIHFRLL